MELDVAVKGMLKTEANLRSREGIMNPVYMSENMMRLSQYTGAVEEKLADYERDLERQTAQLLRQYLIDEKIPVTKAERLVKSELGETKAQVVYLTRIVGSAWKQVGVIQSRINHLVRESQTQV